MGEYFSIMVRLQGRLCIIVGGGRVAERRAGSFLEAGARVRIISPLLTEALERLATSGKLEAQRRTYRTGDLAGAFAVCAATDSPEINAQVCEEAEASGLLVNAADEAGRGNFIVPASLRRGALQIAVSTAGASPAAARDICRDLDERYGDEYETYLDFLGEMRVLAKEHITDAGLRSAVLKRLAGPEVLIEVRGEDFEDYRRRLKETLIRDPLSLLEVR